MRYIAALLAVTSATITMYEDPTPIEVTDYSTMNARCNACDKCYRAHMDGAADIDSYQITYSSALGGDVLDLNEEPWTGPLSGFTAYMKAEAGQ